MATIQWRLTKSLQKSTGYYEVGLRYRRGREVDLTMTTGIYVAPEHFEYYVDPNKNHGKVPATATAEEALKKKYIIRTYGEVVVRNRINNQDKVYHDEVVARLHQLEDMIVQAERTTPAALCDRDWLNSIVEKWRYGDDYLAKDGALEAYLAQFIKINYKGVRAASTIKVAVATLRKLEEYNQHRKGAKKLRLTTLTDNNWAEFAKYLSESLSNSSIKVYQMVYNRFFRWLKSQGLINIIPQGLKIPLPKETTPYFLTLDERKILERLEGLNPQLQVVRDAFILQCHIGCRFSDLMRLSIDNVDGDFISYVPKKTKNKNSAIARVPLTDVAKVIIDRYSAHRPFFAFDTTIGGVNKMIRRIFTIANLTRPIPVVDPFTGQEKLVPLNQLASTHLARRTFIGNLYKKIKDPNIIGSMSGHVEGSTAFARYREIDDDIKKEVITFIE